MNLTQWLSVAGIVIDVLCTTLLIVLIYKRAKVEATKVDKVEYLEFAPSQTPGRLKCDIKPLIGEPLNSKVTVYKDRPPCPKCKSRNAYKNGKRHNGQAYRCRKCLNSYVADA